MARALTIPSTGPDELGEASLGARAGDPDAFRRLVELTHPVVYRLALRLLSDPEEAADVAQETFVRAWSRIEELREPSAALGWICQIARNLARDRTRGWWWRGRRGLEEQPESEPGHPAPGPAPDEALAAYELGAQVRRQLAALSEKHRVVLLLREVDGMDYEEIAQALGVPVGTVESRLHRARKALARRLDRALPKGDER